MNPDTPITTSPTNPGAFRYILGFLLVGAAWGLTTPFMRKAARSAPSSTAPDSRQWLEEVRDTDDEEEKSFVGKGLGKIKAAGWWVKRFVWGRVYAVVDLLKRPAYAVPLLINVTGSVWFFLLVGQSGEFISLSVLSCVWKGKRRGDIGGMERSCQCLEVVGTRWMMY